ncbi:MAG TPA: hypothetical protein VFB13_17770 [Reyranella sp.]|nr:hypothetical protein [Reyranella sp.]
MGDLTDEERRSLRARYEAAAHAMQSGAAIMLDGGSTQATPKHLRVGVNTAMADQGSLARLLIAKGLITEREYYVAIAEGMERERDLYISTVQALLGTDKVSLG